MIAPASSCRLTTLSASTTDPIVMNVQHDASLTSRTSRIGRIPSPQLVVLVMLGVTLLVYSTTLTTSPAAWQDEVQIVDYGRTMIPGSDRTYGVNWSAYDRPYQTSGVVGCLVHELSHRLFQGSMAGPRAASVVSGLLAAYAMYRWLAACAITPWIAVMAALAFLWDPLFVGGYKGARVDALCMASMLTAFWCVRQAAHKTAKRRWLALAGVFVAVSGMTWPTAILLVPLLLYEIFPSGHGSSVERPAKETLQRWILDSLIVGAAAGVVLLVFALLMASNIGTMMSDLRGGVTHVVSGSTSDPLTNVMELPLVFLPSPFLPVLAMTGIVLFGPRSWWLPFLAAMGGVVLSVPYWHRVVYLVPYFAYGLALAADRGLRRRPASPRLRHAVVWACVVVVACNGAISLLARTAVAYKERVRRDPSRVQSFIDDLTVVDRPRVLLRSWSLYYAARSRGWRFWGPMDLRADTKVCDRLDYDYVIFDQAAGPYPRISPLDRSAKTGLLEEALLRQGYTRRVFDLSRGEGAPIVASHAYGPYVVYTHPSIAIASRHEASPP